MHKLKKLSLNTSIKSMENKEQIRHNYKRMCEIIDRLYGDLNE